MNNKEILESSWYKPLKAIVQDKDRCLTVVNFLAVVEAVEINLQNLETRIKNLEQEVKEFLENQ